MTNYVEFLNLPTKIGIGIIVLFFVLQAIGEILEFKGKVVPEFLKIRKYFQRKKRERETLEKVPVMLDKVETLLNDVNKHYSKDNIAMRDKWITDVNEKLEKNDELFHKLDEKLDKNNEDTVSLLVDSKRNSIINFAERVIDQNCSVTREQFNRIFKLYEEYELIIEKNGLTNGEVDIAYRIITEAYEKRMRNHSFIEDIHGYN